MLSASFASASPSNYDQPYRFAGNIKSLARLNQERTACGTQDGRGMYLGFPGVSANMECGIHALAFANFWATSVWERGVSLSHEIFTLRNA